jgi:hypothetical protein
VVQSQPREIVRETLSWKKPITKKGWWSGSWCRPSSGPSTRNKQTREPIMESNWVVEFVPFPPVLPSQSDLKPETNRRDPVNGKGKRGWVLRSQTQHLLRAVEEEAGQVTCWGAQRGQLSSLAFPTRPWKTKVEDFQGGELWEETVTMLQLSARMRFRVRQEPLESYYSKVT